MENKLSISQVYKTDIQYSPDIRPYRLFYKLNGHQMTHDSLTMPDAVFIVVFNVTRKRLILSKHFRPGE